MCMDVVVCSVHRCRVLPHQLPSSVWSPSRLQHQPLPSSRTGSSPVLLHWTAAAAPLAPAPLHQRTTTTSRPRTGTSPCCHAGLNGLSLRSLSSSCPRSATRRRTSRRVRPAVRPLRAAPCHPPSPKSLPSRRLHPVRATVISAESKHNQARNSSKEYREKKSLQTLFELPVSITFVSCKVKTSWSLTYSCTFSVSLGVT